MRPEFFLQARGAFELRLLGALEISAKDGRTGRTVDGLVRQCKRTGLLAYLAAALPHGFHRRDKLLALFWPESDEAHARAALSQALYVLRNALGERAVVARVGGEVEPDLSTPGLPVPDSQLTGPAYAHCGGSPAAMLEGGSHGCGDG